MQSAATIATELANLTGESLTGVGVFDTLMRTTKIHLQEEYDAQRITGHEYATVYLGALTAVLQTSAQFLVNVANAARVDAEIAVMAAQVINENARTANDNTRTANETTKSTAEIAAIQANTTNTTAKVTQEILLMAGQLSNDTTRTGNDTARKTAEVDNMEHKTANDDLKTSAEINAMTANTTNTTNKVDAEILLMTAQRTNDSTRTINDTTRATNDSAKTTAENAALASRTTAEVKLLDQKVATEIANVADALPVGAGLTGGTTITGISGKQTALYRAQALSFKRDAEQKLTKIMADTWMVQKSVDKLFDPNSTSFNDAHATAVVTAAVTGLSEV